MKEESMDFYNGYLKSRDMDFLKSNANRWDGRITEIKTDGCGNVKSNQKTITKFKFREIKEEKIRFDNSSGKGIIKEEEGININELIEEINKFNPKTAFITYLKIKTKEYQNGIIMKSIRVIDKTLKERIKKSNNQKSTALIIQEFTDLENLLEIRKIFGKDCMKIAQAFKTEDKKITWKEIS